MGIGLGKTSGWAHRAALRQAGVELVSGTSYDRIDDAGLYVTVAGQPRVIRVDTVVVCAGQVSLRGLYDDLVADGSATGRRVALSGPRSLVTRCSCGFPRVGTRRRSP